MLADLRLFAWALLSGTILAGCAPDGRGPGYPPSVETPQTSSGATVVRFLIFDVAARAVDVRLEFSTDAGCTFRPATLAAGGNDTRNLASSPGGTVHTVIWDTDVDVPGRMETVVVLQIVRLGPQGGSRGRTGPFVVDNRAPPTVAITTPTSPARAIVLIGYVLADTGGDVADLDVAYSVDGGTTYAPATAAPGGDGVTGLQTSPAGTSHTFAWDSRADLPGGLEPDVVLRMQAGDGAWGPATTTNAFVVDNRVPPTATVETPSGTLTRTASLSYTLVDPQSDPATIAAEYSIDGGTSWVGATEGIGGDGTAGLSTSPTGATHIYMWDTTADLAGVESGSVRFRISPSDTQAGQPGETTGFTVDNDPLITSVSPSGGPIAGGTPVTIRGAGFEPGSSASLGGVPLANLLVVDPSTITGETASSVTVGPVDVTVSGPDGSSTLAGGFLYRLGLIQSGTPMAVAAAPIIVQAGDFDDDGSADVVISSRGGAVQVLYGSGGGTFPTSATVPLAGDIFGLATGLIDADALEDVVVTDIASGVIRVLRGNGAGSFVEVPPALPGISPFPERLDIGDLDEDGDLDVAVPIFGSPLGYSPSSIRVLVGDGAGHLAGGASLATPSGVQHARVADLDGDGHLDIFAGDHAHGTATCYRGLGNGTFLAREEIAVAPNPTEPLVADFDLDGRSEVVLLDAFLAANLIDRLPGGTFRVTPLPSAVDGHAGGVVADINDDGYPDILAAVTGQALCSVYINDRAGGFGLSPLPVPDEASEAAATDLDGDGRTDFVILSTPGETVTVFLAE